MDIDTAYLGFADLILEELGHVIRAFDTRQVKFAPVIVNTYKRAALNGYQLTFQCWHAEDGVHLLKCDFVSDPDQGKAIAWFMRGRDPREGEVMMLTLPAFRGWLQMELERLRDRNCSDVTCFTDAAGKRFDCFIYPPRTGYDYSINKPEKVYDESSQRCLSRKTNVSEVNDV